MHRLCILHRSTSIHSPRARVPEHSTKSSLGSAARALSRREARMCGESLWRSLARPRSIVLIRFCGKGSERQRECVSDSIHCQQTFCPTEERRPLAFASPHFYCCSLPLNKVQGEVGSPAVRSRCEPRERVSQPYTDRKHFRSQLENSRRRRSYSSRNVNTVLIELPSKTDGPSRFSSLVNKCLFSETTSSIYPKVFSARNKFQQKTVNVSLNRRISRSELWLECSERINARPTISYVRNIPFGLVFDVQANSGR